MAHDQAPLLAASRMIVNPAIGGQTAARFQPLENKHFEAGQSMLLVQHHAQTRRRTPPSHRVSLESGCTTLRVPHALFSWLACVLLEPGSCYLMLGLGQNACSDGCNVEYGRRTDSLDLTARTEHSAVVAMHSRAVVSSTPLSSCRLPTQWQDGAAYFTLPPALRMHLETLMSSYTPSTSSSHTKPHDPVFLQLMKNAFWFQSASPDRHH